MNHWKKNSSKILASALSLSLACSMLPTVAQATEMVEEQDRVTITLLQSSDLHGVVNPFDYAQYLETSYSMAHVAAVIEAERLLDPDLILLDCGDTIEGNYVQEFRYSGDHPMVSAMNYLDYDVWTLGNHEFNFEFDNLLRALKQFAGSILSGNIYKDDGTRFQDAYTIIDVHGVKVGIFGVCTPHVPIWEAAQPENYNNMTFTEPLDEIGLILDEMEGQVDIIIGSAHEGLNGEYGVEGMRAVAETYGDRLDALFIGHSHVAVCEEINGVPVLEPSCYGKYVSKLTLTLDNVDGEWVLDKDVTTMELIPCEGVEPDPAFMEATSELHEDSLDLANTEIGYVGQTFVDHVEVLPGIPQWFLEDGPITDLINKVQLEATGADVSMAALFDYRSNLEEGPFLNRDIVQIYRYVNTMFSVEITGEQLLTIMELYAGDFFNQYQEGDVTISFNSEKSWFNYDMFTGVDYEINLSKPMGERIENVIYKGAPLDAEEVLVLALNNYRCGLLVGADVISADQVIYEGGAIREYIADYVANLDGSLMPEVDNNWRITGINLEDPQKDMIYAMVEAGELEIAAKNGIALNGPALREAGVLPALDEETTADVEVEEVTPLIPLEPATPVEETVVIPATTLVPATVVETEVEVAPTTATYTVQSGDTLWSIAAKNLGSGYLWQELFAANSATVKHANKIYTGQVLVLPAV